MVTPIGPIMQFAFVVNDIDAAAREWARTLNAGPFFVLRHITYDFCEHEGAASPVDISAAFGYSGDTQIELIQQHNSAPSVYLQPDGSPVGGLHHAGVVTTDLEGDVAHLEAQGYRLVQRARSPNGGEVAYLAGPSPFLVELILLSPGGPEFFAYLKGLSQTWDGVEPIIEQNN